MNNHNYTPDLPVSPIGTCNTYTKLAAFYGVCTKTIKRWLEPFWKDIGPKQGRYFTPKQVAIIFDKLITYLTPEED